MKRIFSLRRAADSIMAVSVYAAIFVVGLQYAFYRTFSQFKWYDDEGTMLLRVRAFIEDPASYDLFSGVYGPFYYLHKYAIYGFLQAGVSHDINRLTTIAFWGLIAAGCAFLVHRVSRSLVLAAIVQVQLLFLLNAFANEPGHPHEIALALIVIALISSSFIGAGWSGFAGMAAFGAALGALLLVKVNLGVYLGVAMLLALLLLLPPNRPVRILTWLTAAASAALPCAVMLRGLGTPWGPDYGVLATHVTQNYCALATFMIVAVLAAASDQKEGEKVRWADAGTAAGAAAVTIGVVCAVSVALGTSLSAIADGVLLRAIRFPSKVASAVPVSREIAQAGAVSAFLAICYRLAVPALRRHGIVSLLLSMIKLAYGSYVLFSIYRDPAWLRLHIAIPVSFLWLMLVMPHTETSPKLRERFPRVFLCITAAFQVLQGYPVYGSQQLWAVFLMIPVAAICVGDASRYLFEVIKRRFGGKSLQSPSWLQPVSTAILLSCVLLGYHGKGDLHKAQTVYANLTPLDLPGSSHLRLPEFQVVMLRRVVEALRSECDGFVGLPGFASLYFWTPLPAPGPINGAWMLTLEDRFQSLLVERMRTYDRPCVLEEFNLRTWTRGRPMDPRMPLLRYIRTEFKPSRRIGPYMLLVKADTHRGATHDDSGG
jgi:hypothetical protein